MHLLIISNPNSTSQAPELFRRLIPTLRAVEGVTIKAMFTHRKGHAEEICRQAVEERHGLADHGLGRVDVVVAVGGDGTVNEVINGLLGSVPSPDEQLPLPHERDIPRLAIIPTGSANVFARALGFPQDPVLATEVLAKALARNQKRVVELGTWDDRWFAVNAGFGIDAEVIAAVEKARQRGFAATPLRYLRVALQTWLRVRKNLPQISVRARNRHGEELALDNLPILVASNTNPWTYFGPMPVVTNPGNSFDVGLGLFGISNVDGIAGLATMLHLTGVGGQPWFKKIVDDRIVLFDDTSSATFTCEEKKRFQVDGEAAGTHRRVILGTVAEALEVYAPPVPVPDTPLSKVRIVLGFFDIRL